MREMMLLLDDWKAPDPSPWFDGRMMARFREEQARAPDPVGITTRGPAAGVALQFGDADGSDR